MRDAFYDWLVAEDVFSFVELHVVVEFVDSHRVRKQQGCRLRARNRGDAIAR